MSASSWPSELPSEVISILSGSVHPGLKRLFENGMTPAIKNLFQGPQGVLIASKLAAIKPADDLGKRIAEGIPLTLCLLSAAWQDMLSDVLPCPPLKKTVPNGVGDEVPGNNASRWACFNTVVSNATATAQSKSLWQAMEKLSFFQADAAPRFDETPWVKYLLAVSMILVEFKKQDLTPYKAKKGQLTSIAATAKKLADLMVSSTAYFDEHSLMEACDVKHPHPLTQQQEQTYLLRRPTSIADEAIAAAPMYAFDFLDQYTRNSDFLSPEEVVCYKQLIDYRSLRPIDVVHAIRGWAESEANIESPFEKPTVARRRFCTSYVTSLHEELFGDESSMALVASSVGCLLLASQMELGASDVTSY